MYEIQYEQLHTNEQPGSAIPMQSAAWRERQARVMMSPSPANKLGLTLWGPWRKGKGMEWECAVAMLRDNIHRRWEAMVMLGEGGGQAPWNLCEGEGQTTPQPLATPAKDERIQTAMSAWHGAPVFFTDPRGKNNFSGPSLHVIVMSFPDAKQSRDNENKSKKSVSPSVGTFP